MTLLMNEIHEGSLKAHTHSVALSDSQTLPDFAVVVVQNIQVIPVGPGLRTVTGGVFSGIVNQLRHLVRS